MRRKHPWVTAPRTAAWGRRSAPQSAPCPHIELQTLAGARARAVGLEAFCGHCQPFLSGHGILLGVMPVAEDCSVLDTLDEA